MNNKISSALVLLLMFKTLIVLPGGSQSSVNKELDLGHDAGTFTTFAATGNIKKLKDCLEKGVEVNAQDPNGYHSTALKVAADFNKTEAIEFLLAQGACVDQVDGVGNSALSAFLKKEPEKWDQKVLRSLLRRSMNPHPAIVGLTFKTTEDILASWRAIDHDYARKQADFLAENIEAVNDEKRAVETEKVLKEKVLFPQHSVINSTIVSYISDYNEKEELSKPRTCCIHATKKVKAGR